MKSALVIGVAALSLFGAAVAVADDQGAADTTTAKTFVKDSAITTKIKAKLAADHPTSLAKIHVDTDANGIVYLSGSAKTKSDADQAVAIAKATENVMSVHGDIVVDP